MLGILASLLRLLPGNSSGRIRLLAKFVEKNFEKIGRLVRIRREYASKIASVDTVITDERLRVKQEDLEEMESEWLSRRMDAGLFSLQVGQML